MAILIIKVLKSSIILIVMYNSGLQSWHVVLTLIFLCLVCLFVLVLDSMPTSTLVSSLITSHTSSQVHPTVPEPTSATATVSPAHTTSEPYYLPCSSDECLPVSVFPSTNAIEVRHTVTQLPRESSLFRTILFSSGSEFLASSSHPEPSHISKKIQMKSSSVRADFTPSSSKPYIIAITTGILFNNPLSHHLDSQSRRLRVELCNKHLYWLDYN